MYTKIYWLHQYENNTRLAIMARPRGGEWLEDEIVQFKKQHVNVIVSLLGPAEIAELGLKQQETLCQKHGIAYINYSIPDRDIPRSKEKTSALVSQLQALLSEGSSIAVHCRMGIGRSAIIAAAVLLQQGGKAGDILQHISKIRGVKVPDTDDQIRWLKQLQ